MAHKEHKVSQIEPLDENERIYLESLIRSDLERSHPDESLEDLKHRSCFSTEDRGLLRDWMMLAARRAIASHNEKPIIGFNIAA
jgi:hypothetical protein